MDHTATLWTKDPNSESDLLTNAQELVKEAVFGHLEEPLIERIGFLKDHKISFLTHKLAQTQLWGLSQQ